MSNLGANILFKMHGVVAVGDWQWKANCPVCGRPCGLMVQAHPSTDKVVLHCDGGCDPKTVEARLLEVMHL